MAKTARLVTSGYEPLMPGAGARVSRRRDACLHSKPTRGGIMDDEEKLDSSGAYAYKPLLDEKLKPPPEEFTNPAGVSRGDCDTEEAAEQDSGCDLEVTAQIEDLVL